MPDLDADDSDNEDDNDDDFSKILGCENSYADIE